MEANKTQTNHLSLWGGLGLVYLYGAAQDTYEGTEILGAHTELSSTTRGTSRRTMQGCLEQRPEPQAQSCYCYIFHVERTQQCGAQDQIPFHSTDTLAALAPNRPCTVPSELTKQRGSTRRSCLVQEAQAPGLRPEGNSLRTLRTN